MDFQALKLDHALVRILAEHEILSPTEIQMESIRNFRQHPRSHLLGQAKTGSGKTLAFVLPVIEHLNPKIPYLQTLVIVPTRELCKQVASVFRLFESYKDLQIAEIYGGVSIKLQIEAIKKGAQVAVATPGRLIDLYHQREIDFRSVKVVVLDEADKMLNMGFLPDMRFLLMEAMQNITPRLLLYSATLSHDIKTFVHDFAHGDPILEMNVSTDNLTVDECEQSYYAIPGNKYWNFVRILRMENPEYAIVFTKTRIKAEELSRRLNQEKDIPFQVQYISGDLSQSEREKIVKTFRSREIICLIGTDVLARGLDFLQVTHVFNYDLPDNAEKYVHRIGRTARVSGGEKNVLSGKAISLVTASDRKKLQNIEDFTGIRLQLKPLPNSNTIYPSPLVSAKVSPKVSQKSENSQKPQKPRRPPASHRRKKKKPRK